jgi:type III restriction enzyme
MSSFIPRVYQQSVLDSVEQYFRTIHEVGDADTAFYKVTKFLWGKGVEYQPIAGFDPQMPYFCLRVPTGGGKTWLAAKSVRLVNTYLLRNEYGVILWLTPSTAIREQTLRALREREHPYHAALREAGPVTVMDLEEAKSVTPATLNSATVVIVSTVQAFRREDTEGLKVYESNGALMAHFEHLRPEQEKELLRNEKGAAINSLANVLRLRRPFLIVDEAHNSRTDLSFRTFAEFRPSGILELTATPDTERTPSNVLHSVSAAELKAEHMIKLPIRLETEADWQKCLAYAIDCRDQLQAAADNERRRDGAPYLRPVVLIQSQPRRQGVKTLDIDAVRRELIDNQHIPEKELAIATGEQRDLDKIEAEYPKGIADPDCTVKYVLTQRALAEGWDCPSAYVLASMAEMHSSTAVEQLLGRILRQPGAEARKNDALNQSYAFVVSRDFTNTAETLRNRLVKGSGFERREVGEFVAARKPDQVRLDWVNTQSERTQVTPVMVNLPEPPDMRAIPKAVRSKVKWDKTASTLTLAEPLDEAESEAVQQSVGDRGARQAIVEAVLESRKRMKHFATPSEQGETLSVPQMALRLQGELQLFDDPEVLDYPWDLSVYDANVTPEQREKLNANRVADSGEIDIDEKTGRVTTRFLPDLQHDLGLSYRPENWDDERLATWFARNLPDRAATHASKRAYVAHWLTQLLRDDAFSLARVNRQKFFIRGLLEARLAELRREAINAAYQETLFGDDKGSRVVVSEEYTFPFDPQGYAPDRDYDAATSKYGSFNFRKHFVGRIGDFDSKEEFECACKLDQMAQKSRMQFWVRNLVRKSACSFFLQKATRRFYPDFICKLNDGSLLAVEYKGADRWDAAREDRMIGGLWEAMSDGRCRFVMATDKSWEKIEEKLI